MVTECKMIPAILKLFDEILVNARDQKIRLDDLIKKEKDIIAVIRNVKITNVVPDKLSANNLIIKSAAPSSVVTVFNEYARAIIKRAPETFFMPLVIKSPTSNAFLNLPLKAEIVIRYVTVNIKASTIFTAPRKMAVNIPTPIINTIGKNNSSSIDGLINVSAFTSILSLSDNKGEEPGLINAPVSLTLFSAIFIGPKSGINPKQISNVNKINRMG